MKESCIREEDGQVGQEIWKYCQSTSKLQPRVLQTLRVRWTRMLHASMSQHQLLSKG